MDAHEQKEEAVKTYKYNERSGDFTMTVDLEELETIRGWVETHILIINSLGAGKITDSGREMLSRLIVTMEQMTVLLDKHSEAVAAKQAK